MMGTHTPLMVLGLPPSQLLPSQLSLLWHNPSMLEKLGTALQGKPTQASRTSGEAIKGLSTYMGLQKWCSAKTTDYIYGLANPSNLQGLS